jgi:hypothetical protein
VPSSSLLAVLLVVHLVVFVSFSAGIGSMWGGGRHEGYEWLFAQVQLVIIGSDARDEENEHRRDPT